MRLLVKVFLIWLSAMSTSQAQEFQVMSDFDDTVAISSPGSTKKTVFAKLEPFSGMVELIQAWRRGAGSGSQEMFSILTGKPRTFRYAINRFQKETDVQFDRIRMRRLYAGEWKTQSYKREVLEEWLQESDLPVVLIGDDLAYDPEVFSQIERKYPDRVQQIYIHAVSGRDLPNNIKMIRYYSSYEVAFYEARQGRISENDAIEVGEAVFRRPQLVIPDKFFSCPKNSVLTHRQHQGFDRLDEMARLVLNRLNEICREARLRL